jgi:arylsulfatase A-like enzyme
MKPPFGAMAFEAFAPLSDVPQVPPDPDKGIPGYTGWREGTEPFHYESETDRDLMADEKNAIWVSEQLQKPRKNPFFMAVGMNRPHSPWFAPKKYFDMFPLDTIQLPPYLENDLEDCAEILWKEAKHHPLKNLGMSRLERLRQAYGGTNEGWKRWIQAYLACAAFVDDQVGKILDSLEKSEFADNTIVVFTSDHGFHMGEKDLLCKRTVWEESTRVPFVCKVPRLTPKGAKCEHPVSLVDLYPTLNELCGLPAPDIQYSDQRPLDGFSLIPFLKHPEYDRWEGPDVALSCIYGDKELELNEPGKIQDQHFTVRSRQYRYSRCADGSEELYDHQNDPNEWHNLAAEPKYKAIKEKLQTEMDQLVHRSS